MRSGEGGDCLTMIDAYDERNLIWLDLLLYGGRIIKN